MLKAIFSRTVTYVYWFKLCNMESKSIFRKYSKTLTTQWIRTTRSTEKVKEKGKGKAHLITGHEGPEGTKNYNTTLPLTSVLDGLAPHPGYFTSGLNRCTLYRWLGGFEGRSGRLRKFSLPLGIDSQTVWLVASRNIGYAVVANWTQLNRVTFETLIAANRSKYYLYFAVKYDFYCYFVHESSPLEPNLSHLIQFVIPHVKLKFSLHVSWKRIAEERFNVAHS